MWDNQVNVRDVFVVETRFGQVPGVGRLYSIRFLRRPFCTIRPSGGNCAARSLDQISGRDRGIGRSNRRIEKSPLEILQFPE